MRYRIGGKIVRTENAAKPVAQRSEYLHRFIASLPRVDHALDIGCGKLRYHESIAASANRVTFIDSEVQLSRFQKLGPYGYNSIRMALADSNSAHCLNVGEFRRSKVQADRGFCLNVLPIVPSHEGRRRLVELSRKRLKDGANCYFVVHFNNKEYRRLSGAEGSKQMNDGYLLKSLRGYSFFAILKPTYLANLVSEGGFEVKNSRVLNGSCLVEARAI